MYIYEIFDFYKSWNIYEKYINKLKQASKTLFLNSICKLKEHNSIFIFILIPDMFSNFKSGENYRFYLKRLGFAEEKPHRFNEINVIYIKCASPNLGS